MDNLRLSNSWPYVWMCHQGSVACPTLGLKTIFQHFMEWKERLCVRGFNIGWLGITFIKKIKIDFISILFILIIKLKNIIYFLYIFPMETSQMFIVCKDFVGVRHVLHQLKCDLVLECLLMCFKTKFEHFMHDVYIFNHAHHFTFYFYSNTFNWT